MTYCRPGRSPRLLMSTFFHDFGTTTSYLRSNIEWNVPKLWYTAFFYDKWAVFVVFMTCFIVFYTFIYSIHIKFIRIHVLCSLFTLTVKFEVVTMSNTTVKPLKIPKIRISRNHLLWRHNGKNTIDIDKTH